ncbi:MAG: glycosyltransferase family 4 protein [bacterium]
MPGVQEAFEAEAAGASRGEQVRVLHLAEGASLAGIETHICALLKEMKRSPRVGEILFACFYDGPLKKRLEQIGVRCLCLRRTCKLDPAVIRRLRSVVRSHRVEILHMHGYLAAIHGQIAALTLPQSVLTLTTAHQRAERHPSWKMNLYVRIMFRLSRLAGTHSVVVSENVRQSILDKYRMGAERITTIHNGVDIGCENVARKTREELGLDPGKKAIGIIGRLVEAKRHDLFVRVAQEICRERSDVEFVILGDGPLRTAIERKIAEAGMGGHVKLMGHRPNVLEYLQRLDLMVICSDHEGIPYVLLEALLLRKPIVSTRAGGIPEVIRSGFNGVLVGVGDAEAMKREILALLRDPDRAHALAENGHRTVIERFSAQAMAEKTLDLYERLKAAKKGPS